MAKKTNKEEKKEFTAHELESKWFHLLTWSFSNKIGIILRDEYGVNFSEVTNKKIQEVLRE